MILVPLCISFYYIFLPFFFLLIIITLCINFVMVNYYVIHAYCILCAVVLWVGGVDVYNVGSPLSVCACFMGAPGAKTINVFRACLGAQLTICAQK